ncbi:MAG TPA: hypothetical protein VE987_19035 [Polyangiaceae bacterium]|nr:hypothetical protein [Polyangiaceae bacterium]
MKRRSWGGAAFLLATLGGGVAAAGCNLLVGVGDYSIADGGTDGTFGGADAPIGSEDAAADRSASADAAGDGRSDAGDARPDHDAARANDAAVEDTGLDAGTDAGGDAAGPETGVTCGQTLPPPNPDAGTDFQKLVTTCVLAISCDPFLFPITLSDCITRNELQAILPVACLTQITDCSGYYACQGSRYATATECPAGSTTGMCGGTNQELAIDCFTGSVKNCAKTGGTCATVTDANGLRADCVVVPSCTDTSGNLLCTNNQLYSCFQGVGYGSSCDALGATCSTTGSRGTDCYFNSTTTCTTPGTATCSTGTTVTACAEANQRFDFDCSRAGGSCQTDATGNGACVAPGCSTTSSCAEVCTGAVVTACVGGAPYTIDCTQYGFSSCAGGAGNPVYCLP